jgi:hypothetical protein
MSEGVEKTDQDSLLQRIKYALAAADRISKTLEDLKVAAWMVQRNLTIVKSIVDGSPVEWET